MRPRLILVCLITAALLAAAGWSGGLSLILTADRVHAVPIIGALILLGIWKGWRGDWDGVEWWADKLPILGLIGTVLGVLLAIQGVTTIDDATRLRIFTEVGEALVANMLGIAGYGWLSLLRRVCDR